MFLPGLAGRLLTLVLRVREGQATAHLLWGPMFLPIHVVVNNGGCDLREIFGKRYVDLPQHLIQTNLFGNQSVNISSRRSSRVY